MSDMEQCKRIELTDPNADQHLEVVTQATNEEAIGLTTLSGASVSEQVTALDDQVPRSWDLHKSGW